MLIKFSQLSEAQIILLSKIKNKCGRLEAVQVIRYMFPDLLLSEALSLINNIK